MSHPYCCDTLNKAQWSLTHERRKIATLLAAAEALLAADDATPNPTGSTHTTLDQIEAHHERWTAARDALRAAVEKAKGTA